MQTDHDPDDNFARSAAADVEIDEDAALEVLAWQLLLMVNPDDEEAARHQFETVRDDLAAGREPLEAIRAAIDWQAGFHVGAGDVAGAIDVLDQLAARRGVRIDWGVDDTDDAAFLADIDVPGIIAIAYDRLREDHYTLWTWDAGHDHHAGWITRQHDDEAVPVLAGALGFHVRPGAG